MSQVHTDLFLNPFLKSVYIRVICEKQKQESVKKLTDGTDSH